MGIKSWLAERQQAKVSRGPTGNTARRWAFCGVTPLAALFLVVGAWRNWTTAYQVLTGSENPRAAHAGVAAVLLSIGGYLIVPLVVGTAAAGFFQRSVEKKTRLDLAAVARAGLPAGTPGTTGESGERTSEPTRPEEGDGRPRTGHGPPIGGDGPHA
jgi:hypothetical protein